MENSRKKEGRNWVDLPRGVTASILSRVPAVKILRCAQIVCKEWFEVAKDPLVWRADPSVHLDYTIAVCPSSYDLNRNVIVFDDEIFDLYKMFLDIVDRSCARSLGISIEFICNDAMLDCLAQSNRSSKIKSLRIACAANLSNEGLLKAVEKLPLLEHVELSCYALGGSSVEALGRLCPHLKSFNWNITGGVLDVKAVSRSMPGLRQLELIGGHMTDSDLDALVRGCPHLESLDLRGCCPWKVDLAGETWRRCTQKVKKLRAPEHEVLLPFNIPLVYVDFPIKSLIHAMSMSLPWMVVEFPIIKEVTKNRAGISLLETPSDTGATTFPRAYARFNARYRKKKIIMK